jgi:hypothetical protein
MNEYCVDSKWYSHFGRCSHCWSDLCGYCFMSCFFLGSGCNDCNSSKYCITLRPTFWRWFHPSNSRNIWMFTLASGQPLSSICQCGMVNKGLWRSFFLYMSILWPKGVSASSESLGCHYLALGSCDDLSSLFYTWCPSRFFTHLLVRLASCYWWWVWVLGLVFSSLWAPHCGFCTFQCGLLFGLQSIPFSSLAPLLGVFSFIYLFLAKEVPRSMFPMPYQISQEKNQRWKRGAKKSPRKGERERGTGRTHPSVSNQIVQVSTFIHNRTVPRPLNTQDGSFYIHARAHFAWVSHLKDASLHPRTGVNHPSRKYCLSFSLSRGTGLSSVRLRMQRSSWVWWKKHGYGVKFFYCNLWSCTRWSIEASFSLSFDPSSIFHYLTGALFLFSWVSWKSKMKLPPIVKVTIISQSRSLVGFF